MNIAPNVGSNVDTGASARTTAAGYGQISVTRKHFLYFKQSLIS